MKNKPFFKNKNFLIIAALVVVIAVVLVIALTQNRAPAIAPDAQRIELTGTESEQDMPENSNEKTEAAPAEDGEAENAAESETQTVNAAGTSETANETEKAEGEASETQPSADSGDACQLPLGLPEAPAYVLCSLPGSGQYGIIPLPKEGSVSYPIRQTFPDGTQTENVLCLTPEGFCMESSTCANQDCVGQGTVTIENREERVLRNSVICLPNQVMAELYTAEEIAAMNLPAAVEASEEAVED